ncbi:MAG: putative glycoside hydrolase, partial [Actinomycetota bacterium]
MRVASPLLDPTPRRRMFKRRETLPPLRQSMPILHTPAGAGRRRRSLFDGGPRRRPDLLVVLCVLAGVWLAWIVGRWIWTETRVEVRVVGIEAGAALTGEEAEKLVLEITVDPVEDLERTTVTFGEFDITDVLERKGDRLRWVPGTGFIVEGEHQLKVSVPRSAFGPSTHTTTFVVDLTPPEFDLPHATEPQPIDEAVEVRGRVDPEATVTVDGEPYETDDGEIELSWDVPPAAPIVLTATDRAGNRTRHELIVPVQYPGGRSVHVTPAAWRSPNLRQGVLDLIDQGRIDTVELDIKDEGGLIGHRSAVPLARAAGASQDLYDLRDVVETLRDRGVRVVGRLVVFRDPKVAKWAADNGEADLLIQQPDGSPHPAYGGFTNIASEEVWDYNIALALEAVDAGVGDILYDYIRRPEGSLAEMHIPGLK